MKILHVIDLISQTRAGGSAKVPYHLAKEQAEQGHDVTIFASDWDAADQEPPEGVKLVKFKTLINLCGFRITPGLLKSDIRGFDIIHLHNFRTFLNLVVSFRARQAGIPYVLQPHGSMPINNHKKLNGFIDKAIWNRCIMHPAGRLIAVSQVEVKQFESMTNRLDRIVSIPNGINLREFVQLPERGEFRKQYDINPENKIVLFLGRLHEIKGLELLAKAFVKMNRTDITLVIAGYDNGYQAEFTSLIEKLGIADRVLFIGAVYGKDKLRAYTDADVYVLPSRYEIFGITVLEALACGTPVIVTDCCGLADIIYDEYGLCVPYDEETLACAMLKILKNDTIEMFKDKRQEQAHQYGWDKIAGQMNEMYLALLFARNRKKLGGNQ